MSIVLWHNGMHNRGFQHLGTAFKIAIGINKFKVLLLDSNAFTDAYIFESLNVTLLPG